MGYYVIYATQLGSKISLIECSDKWGIWVRSCASAMKISRFLNKVSGLLARHVPVTPPSLIGRHTSLRMSKSHPNLSAIFGRLGLALRSAESHALLNLRP
jgi:hypothetical protein